MRRIFGVFLGLGLMVAAVTATAHFQLNLNVRIFHIEHLERGLRIYARVPMPYLVADKIGETGEGELPMPAPFTWNAREDGKVVHYIDMSAISADPPGLGEIAEAGSVVEIDGNRYRGTVEAVAIHRVGSEPGFATLSEARDALSNGTSLSRGSQPYVGDIVVDVAMIYTPGFAPSKYRLSSTLVPGLPDQEMTANLVLDYAPGDPLVYRSRGLLTDPIEISRSRISAIATFVWEGVRHILEGLDHVLFVACLVIGAPALRDLLWRVTGFTVGHSVTLSLGFFGFVPSGAWFVPTIETGIALSIIYAAYLAIRTSVAETRATRAIFAVTVAIGLLHGLGFSFVLQEILQINSPNIWQALLAFNVGVEIGQLAIVLMIWPLLSQITKRGPRIAKSARVSVALGCSLIATWWTIERAGSVFLALSG